MQAVKLTVQLVNVSLRENVIREWLLKRGYLEQFENEVNIDDTQAVLSFLARHDLASVSLYDLCVFRTGFKTIEEEVKQVLAEFEDWVLEG